VVYMAGMQCSVSSGRGTASSRPSQRFIVPPSLRPSKLSSVGGREGTEGAEGSRDERRPSGATTVSGPPLPTA